MLPGLRNLFVRKSLPDEAKHTSVTTKTDFPLQNSLHIYDSLQPLVTACHALDPSLETASNQSPFRQVMPLGR